MADWRSYENFYDFIDGIVDEEIGQSLAGSISTEALDYVIVGACREGEEWIREPNFNENNPMEIQAFLSPLTNFFEELEKDYGQWFINEIKNNLKLKYNCECNYCVVVGDSYDYFGVYFFDNEEEALDELKELENSEQPYVEEYIEDFEKKVNAELEQQKLDRNFINVKFDEVKQDFQIYVNGDILIIDNAKELGADEIDEVISFIEFMNEMKEKHEIFIVDCEKHKDSIGFNRYYTFTFMKDGIEVEEDIELSGWIGQRYSQGNKRTIKELIENEIDIDELLDEFEEEKKLDLELDL